MYFPSVAQQSTDGNDDDDDDDDDNDENQGNEDKTDNGHFAKKKKRLPQLFAFL